MGLRIRIAELVGAAAGRGASARLASDAAWRGVHVVGRQGAGFAVFAMAAFYLAPEDLGRYSLLITGAAFAMMFADFGFTGAVARFVAEASADNARAVREIVGAAWILLPAGLVLAGAAAWLLTGGAAAGASIWHAAPFFILTPLVSLYDGVLRGLQRFRAAGAATVITVIVGLPAAWFIVREGGMVRAVWAQNALQFVLFAGLFALQPSLGRPPSLAALRRVGRYAGLIGLAGLGFFLYTRVDVLILGQFGYIEEIGYYDLVMKVFNLFLLPFGVVAQAAGPRMAILASKEGPRALRPRARRAMAVVAPLGILAALVYGAGLYPAARLLLPHLAAPALLTASLMLAVLLPLRCWSIYLTQGLIVPGGMARIVTATTLAGAAANIAADYLLVGPFGFTGVVAATLLVHSAVTVANHALFMRACRTAREAA